MAWNGDRVGHRIAALKAQRRRFRGKVTRVPDGDTVMVKKAGGGYGWVRIAGYDAPERYQFGGAKAMHRLRGLVGGKPVTVEPVGTSYGRTVANVRVGRRDVRRFMERR